MGIVESEADAIAWVHQMAKTPTPGDHEVADPHPYCLGDDPCCCVQLIAAEQTARADEREKAAGRAVAEMYRWDMAPSDPDAKSILAAIAGHDRIVAAAETRGWNAALEAAIKAVDDVYPVSDQWGHHTLPHIDRRQASAAIAALRKPEVEG